MKIAYTVFPPPPNTADLGTDEKAMVFGNRLYLGGGGGRASEKMYFYK